MPLYGVYGISTVHGIREKENIPNSNATKSLHASKQEVED